MTLSLNPPVCLSTCTVFFFLLINTCFTTSHLCGNSLLPSRRGRALSLTSGLMSRIQLSLLCPDLSLQNQSPRLQVEATPDQSGSKQYFFFPSFWRYRIMCLFQNYLNLVTLTSSEFESNSDTFVIKSHSGPFCIDSRKQL